MVEQLRSQTGVRVVPIDSVRPHPDNPRRGNVERIAKSLKHFGQIRPIVIRAEDDTIVAGNHTHKAAKSLGWSEIAIVQVSLDDEDARAYLLADNRTSDVAGYDDAALVAVLEDLNERGRLEATGFTYDDLEDLVSAIEGVKETARQEFEGGYAEPPEDTAERWADRNEGQRREVVFLLLEQDFNNFRSMIEDLKKVWSLSSMADTIFQAIRVVHEHECADHDAPTITKNDG